MNAQSQDRDGGKEPKAGQSKAAEPRRVPNADMQGDDAGTADSGNEAAPGAPLLEQAGNKDK
jgi:hypothetical protein